MSFSVPLIFLVSDSHLSFPNCQPHPPPSPSLFPCQFCFFPCSSCTRHPKPSRHHLTRTWLFHAFHRPWQSVTPDQPGNLFYLLASLLYLWLVEKTHSAMLMLISFSSYFQPYSPLHIAQGISHKSLVGLTFLSSYRKCSSINP